MSVLRGLVWIGTLGCLSCNLSRTYVLRKQNSTPTPIYILGGRRLGAQAIERVVGERDGLARPREPREHVAVGIVAERLGARIRVGRGGEPVEAVIGEAGGAEGGVVAGDGQARGQPVRRVGPIGKASP
jgi:hypothetical protein